MELLALDQIAMGIPGSEQGQAVEFVVLVLGDRAVGVLYGLQATDRVVAVGGGLALAAAFVGAGRDGLHAVERIVGVARALMLGTNLGAVAGLVPAVLDPAAVWIVDAGQPISLVVVVAGDARILAGLGASRRGAGHFDLPDLAAGGVAGLDHNRLKQVIVTQALAV